VHQWLVYRREVTHTPVRTLAAEIGISKSAVEHFYKSRTYPGKNWPKLRDWYVRNRAEKQREYQTDPRETVMAALFTFDHFPVNRRPVAMRRIAEQYKALYDEMELPVPEWVDLLTKLADDYERRGSGQN
jgi:AcrR family transcriptional regulator